MKRLLAVSIAAVLLAGCGGSSSSSDSTTPVVQVTNLSGQVLNKETLEPIANVTVKVNDKVATTDNQGRYSVVGVNVGSSTIIVTAPGYTTQVLTQTLSANTNGIDFNLVPADATVRAPASEAIVVRVPVNQAINLAQQSARVSIPANSLVRVDGRPVVGQVNVQFSIIDSAQEPEAMPGGYQIVGGGWMESFGALSITALDDSGAALTLANGQVANIRIPVSTRGNLQETMPLFYFDSVRNGWVQSGTSTLTENSDGTLVYVGTIDRIAPWNADLVMQTTTLTGCVQDTNGTRLANAIISGDGIDYSSITKAKSDAQGNFSLPVRTSSSLYVMAQSGTKSSEAQKVTTTSVASNLSQCLVVSAQNNSVTMKLTWGSSPEDVDAHLITPNGEEIYYNRQGSLTSQPYANLDVDDVTSFGPEVTTIRRLQVGIYHYGINNYSETLEPNMQQSPIRVELAGAKLTRRIITPTVSDGTNYFWHAFDLVVDASCNVTYQPINKWLVDVQAFKALTPVYNANPQYCVAP